jgi:hypothetical protein
MRFPERETLRADQSVGEGQEGDEGVDLQCGEEGEAVRPRKWRRL